METIDISAIGKILRKRAWFILLLVVCSVAAAGWVSFYVLKPEYEAKATIVVQGQSRGEDSLYNDLRANQELVKTYGAIIKSKKIADEVIRSLQLSVTAEELLKKVRVQETEESLVTTISVTDHDPQTAVNIANGFARSFQQNVGSIMKVDNVAILDEARTIAEPEPIRPKPFLYMAIAFVLALLGSIGLSFLLEFADKTIRREEQIEHVLGIPVLGVITNIDPKNAYKSKQEGVVVRHEG